MTLKEKIQANQLMVDAILKRIGPDGVFDLDSAMRLNTINTQSAMFASQYIDDLEKQNDLLTKLANRLSEAKPDPSSAAVIKVNVQVAIDIIKSIGYEVCDSETLKELAVLILDTHFSEAEYIQGLQEENKVLLEEVKCLKNKR